MFIPSILKRYFPNTPNWLLGGSIFVLLLWLVVCPAEFIEIVIRQEYLPISFLGWSVRFLYLWGYLISLFLIRPFADSPSFPDQLLGLGVVLFGLLITCRQDRKKWFFCLYKIENMFYYLAMEKRHE